MAWQIQCAEMRGGAVALAPVHAPSTHSWATLPPCQKGNKKLACYGTIHQLQQCWHTPHPTALTTHTYNPLQAFTQGTRPLPPHTHHHALMPASTAPLQTAAGGGAGTHTTHSLTTHSLHLPPPRRCKLQLVVAPVRSGVQFGSINFKAPDGAYVWFSVEVRATEPPPVGTINVEAQVGCLLCVCARDWLCWRGRTAAGGGVLAGLATPRGHHRRGGADRLRMPARAHAHPTPTHPTHTHMRAHPRPPPPPCATPQVRTAVCVTVPLANPLDSAVELVVRYGSHALVGPATLAMPPRLQVSVCVLGGGRGARSVHSVQMGACVGGHLAPAYPSFSQYPYPSILSFPRGY